MEPHAPKHSIEWTYLEEKKLRGTDWFWTVGATSLALALAAVLMHNWLFGVLILLSAVTIMLGAAQKPRNIRCSLSPRGVVVNKQFFPYNNLTSFWIEENHSDATLIFEVKGTLVSHLWLKLHDETAPREVRKYLTAHLPEVRHEMSLAEALGERLGI